MRPRHKHNRHRSKPVIKFYSHKNQCHIWCESILERNYALSLEFDDNVFIYASQPDSFKVFGRRYTPDFFVLTMKRKGYFVEVKHSGIIKKTNDFYKSFELKRLAIREQTMQPLILITEKDASDNYGKTLKNLYRFLDIETKSIINTLDLPYEIVFDEFCELLGGNDAVSTVWALIAQNVYIPEEPKKITHDSLLFLKRTRG